MTELTEKTSFTIIRESHGKCKGTSTSTLVINDDNIIDVLCKPGFLWHYWHSEPSNFLLLGAVLCIRVRVFRSIPSLHQLNASSTYPVTIIKNVSRHLPDVYLLEGQSDSQLKTTYITN